MIIWIQNTRFYEYKWNPWHFALTWAVFIGPNHFWGPRQVEDHKLRIVRLCHNRLKFVNLSIWFLIWFFSSNFSSQHWWRLALTWLNWLQCARTQTMTKTIKKTTMTKTMTMKMTIYLRLVRTSFSLTAVCILLTLEFSLAKVNSQQSIKIKTWIRILIKISNEIEIWI